MMVKTQKVRLQTEAEPFVLDSAQDLIEWMLRTNYQTKTFANLELPM
jgi:hypothetical protein